MRPGFDSGRSGATGGQAVTAFISPAVKAGHITEEVTE